jgi:tRNA A-37 threonylcarbamoyl transferase component Bud32
VKEKLLPGGRQTKGIVRVGETVRRPPRQRSGYVRSVLRHLEAVGFDGAPRLLGVDEQGREVLSYLPGETLERSPVLLSAARLRSAARLIRRFHDVTAGTPLARGEEVVCHGDLGPHNMVFDGERAVGLIDWDEGVAPGRRLVDFAHAVWCCADVAEGAVPVAEQARKVRLMCDAYGWPDAGTVVEEIASSFRRARDRHAAGGRERAAAIFEQMERWIEHNAAELKHASQR